MTSLHRAPGDFLGPDLAASPESYAYELPTAVRAELSDLLAAIARRSRAYSGGLRTSEYLLHGTVLTLRGAAIAFSLAAGTPPSAKVSDLKS
jgi:hypothetical protein